MKLTVAGPLHFRAYFALRGKAITQSMRTYSRSCFHASGYHPVSSATFSLSIPWPAYCEVLRSFSLLTMPPKRKCASRKSVNTKKSSQPFRRCQARRSTAPEVDGLSPTVVSLDSNVQLEVSDTLSLHELLSAVGQRVREEMQSVTGVQRQSQSSGHSLTQEDSQRLFHGNVYSQAAGSAVQQPLPFTEDSRGVLNGSKKALPCVFFFNP